MLLIFVCLLSNVRSIGNYIGYASVTATGSPVRPLFEWDEGRYTHAAPSLLRKSGEAVLEHVRNLTDDERWANLLLPERVNTTNTSSGELVEFLLRRGKAMHGAGCVSFYPVLRQLHENLIEVSEDVHSEHVEI